MSTEPNQRIARELLAATAGRVYRNVYHYLMWFRDGKVLRVKEYLDTQSAVEFFG